ncbi:MAG TPA: DNA primase [bacterium]
MKIPEHKIEEVRSATDILTVVQGYVALKKRGQNWFGLCPWHAETQGSFSVHTGKQIFHCFSCGRGGNVFSFLMEMERVSFTEAVKMLAERAGIELPAMRGGSDEEESESEQLVKANGLARDFFYKQLTDGRSAGAEEARRYLESRGYGSAVIERYLLGYAPDSWDEFTKFARSTGIPTTVFLQAGLLKEKDGRYYDAYRHRIIFPIRNLAGRVIAFGGRRLRDEAETAKYINSPESAVYRKGRELFGLWEARNDIRTREEAMLVEGYTDCLSLVMAGVSTAVASLGTALTENQARLVKRFAQNVYILYDGDNAGLGAARRAIDVLLAAGTSPRVIVLPPEEDPDSYVRKHGGEAVWKLKNESALSPAEFQLLLAKHSGRNASEAARRLVESAALIESPVEQDVFLREAAEQTGVSLDAMRRELDRSRAPIRQDSQQVTPPRTNWPPPGILTDLARTLIRRPELRPVAFANWASLRIEDPTMRELFKVMYEEWRHGDGREPVALLDVFVEPPLRDFVSDSLFESGESEDADRALDADRQFVLDSLRNLEADRVREELADLKRRLTKSPDDMDLLTQMQNLMKKEKELRRKPT